MCHPSPEHTQWSLQDSTASKPDSASLSCPIKAAQPGTGAEMPPGYPAVLAQDSQSFCRREKGGVRSRRTRPHECRPVARKKVLGQGSAFPPGRRAAVGRREGREPLPDARVTAGPKRPHLSVCPGPNFPLQGRQGSRGCIPGSRGSVQQGKSRRDLLSGNFPSPSDSSTHQALPRALDQIGPNHGPLSQPQSRVNWGWRGELGGWPALEPAGWAQQAGSSRETKGPRAAPAVPPGG